MSFNKEIENHLQQMTKSMHQVASFYLANTNKAAFFTLDEAAHEIGVSTTTVIRFSRLLGYSGFTEMQKDIQDELVQKISLPERLSKFKDSTTELEDELLSNSMKQDIADITKTFTSLDMDSLKKIIHSINTAETIYVLGMRSSFALAHYTTSRLAQIRPNVRLIEGSGMLFPEIISGCTKNDLCIAFAFPRYSTTTLDILSWMHKKGTKILLFTVPENQTVNYADFILRCYLTSVSFKNSITAPISLINYLAAVVAISDHKTAVNTIKDTEDFLLSGKYITEKSKS